MRITSGILRNRRFNVPQQEVRPTKEQVREAVFSALGGHCEGMRVLDLFAGSGSLGLEAWSRGAASVTFVEQHAGVFRCLEGNVAQFQGGGLGTAACIRSDVFRFLEQTRERFDLILADPPYELADALARTLERIAGHSVLTADGVLVYELRASDACGMPSGWRLLRDRQYGQTRVLILKQKKEDEP